VVKQAAPLSQLSEDGLGDMIRVNTTEERTLHPMGVPLDKAQFQMRSLQAFMRGELRSLQLTSSSLLLPRLLAALALVGALLLFNPRGTGHMLSRAHHTIQDLLSHASSSRNHGPAQQAPDEAGFHWSDAAVRAFEQALLDTPKGTPGRWETIASAVGCSAAEAAAREKDTRAAGNRAAARADSALRHRVAKVQQQEHEQEAELAATVLEADASEAAKKNKAEWTQMEQRALEQGLKEHTKDDPKRWEKIAGGVGTKTKKECVTRYKAIAMALKS